MKRSTDRLLRAVSGPLHDLHSVAARLGFTERQAAQLEGLYPEGIPDEAVDLLIALSDRAFLVVNSALAKKLRKETIDDSPRQRTDGYIYSWRAEPAHQISALDIVEHFRSVYGDSRLYFTILPWTVEHESITSTFAEDNIENLEPYLLVQQAKLRSGASQGISLVVRVFDFEHRISVRGPSGIIGIPNKDIFMFSCTQDGVEGISAEEAERMSSVDHLTGGYLASEEGVHYRDSRKIAETR
jgi:hypothetical protein